MTDRTENIKKVISSLEAIRRFYESKATPRRQLKTIRWALICAIECVEKQIPKKPIRKKREHILHYECPCCGFTTLLPHCGNCGQAIDWEEGAE